MKFTKSMICHVIFYNEKALTFYFVLLVLSYVTDPTILQVNAENFSNDTYNKEFNLTFNQLEYQHNQSNNTKSESNDLLESQGECQEEIEIDESSLQYNKENLECVAGLINTCNNGDDVYLLYATGSMYLKTLGLKNGSCQMDVVHEIERDSNSYSCLIPNSKLSVWDSWKNGDGLDALGNITNYCSQK